MCHGEVSREFIGLFDSRFFGLESVCWTKISVARTWLGRIKEQQRNVVARPRLAVKERVDLIEQDKEWICSRQRMSLMWWEIGGC